MTEPTQKRPQFSWIRIFWMFDLIILVIIVAFPFLVLVNGHDQQGWSFLEAEILLIWWGIVTLFGLLITFVPKLVSAFSKKSADESVVKSTLQSHKRTDFVSVIIILVIVGIFIIWATWDSLKGFLGII